MGPGRVVRVVRVVANVRLSGATGSIGVRVQFRFVVVIRLVLPGKVLGLIVD